MTHPLTDEVCRQIAPFSDLWSPTAECHDMRAAYDLGESKGREEMLEQVIKWIRNYPRVGDACPIYDFETESDRSLLIEDLKEAMRPQEDNQ